MKKGQSMFEVVLAIAVIALIVVGVVILATSAIRNSTFSKNKTLSSRFAQEAIEWIRNERNSDTQGFRIISLTPKYCLNNLSWGNLGPCSGSELISGTVFKREVSFSSTTQTNVNGEDVIIINADVEVTWTDSQGLHSTKSVTDFADFREQ